MVDIIVRVRSRLWARVRYLVGYLVRVKTTFHDMTLFFTGIQPGCA